MRERPILFSAPMVRAILEGRKTQTRRVVIHKGQQPPSWATWINHIKQLTMKHEWVDSNIFQWSEEQTSGQPLKTLRRWPSGEVKVTRKYSTEMDYAIPCPYGVPGNRLWVKETLCSHSGFALPLRLIPQVSAIGQQVWSYGADNIVDVTRKHPSIFMPRWASRITLEVTGVRVERVQDISEEDAMAEGASYAVDCLKAAFSHQQAFMMLWDSINAKRGFGWDENPWVWVVEFKRVTASASEKPAQPIASRSFDTPVHVFPSEADLRAYGQSRSEDKTTSEPGSEVSACSDSTGDCWNCKWDKLRVYPSLCAHPDGEGVIFRSAPETPCVGWELDNSNQAVKA